VIREGCQLEDGPYCMVGGQVDERYGGSFVTEAAEKFNIT